MLWEQCMPPFYGKQRQENSLLTDTNLIKLKQLFWFIFIRRMTDENLSNNEKVVSQNRPKQEVLVANFQQQQQQKKPAWYCNL